MTIEIVRRAEIPWEDRKNVDGWPSRAGMYCDDRANQLCMRLIDYPVGSTEPRHVHGGAHATTVLKGRAIVDGLTLGPLDVVLGPSNEPHGPLHYPEGCQLFSVFHGSYYHSEIENLSAEKHYRLIQSGPMPWARADGYESKTLVARGVGPLLLRALKFQPGAQIAETAPLPFYAALVIDGEAAIGEEKLGDWDFMRVTGRGARETIRFPHGATLLAVSLQ
ncbi:MAG: hypothetical protein ACT4P8_03255 [Betaproteobacteria bacterium]